MPFDPYRLEKGTCDHCEEGPVPVACFNGPEEWVRICLGCLDAALSALVDFANKA